MTIVAVYAFHAHLPSYPMNFYFFRLTSCFNLNANFILSFISSLFMRTPLLTAFFFFFSKKKSSTRTSRARKITKVMQRTFISYHDATRFFLHSPPTHRISTIKACKLRFFFHPLLTLLCFESPRERERAVEERKKETFADGAAAVASHTPRHAEMNVFNF